MAEVLPLLEHMPAKLHLVKGLERETVKAEAGREERFRYPGPEEVWEVSCEGRADTEDKRPEPRRQAS